MEGRNVHLDIEVAGIADDCSVLHSLKVFAPDDILIARDSDEDIPDLGRIRCPTLVLGGAQDAVTPPEVLQEIADAISGARLILLDRCGHLSPLEQPDAVTAALRDWLTAR